VRRRQFIAGLGAAAWPLAARAQQARLKTIGYLGGTTSSIDNPRLGAFVQRLREHGWTEGRTIAIEARWADGRNDRFAEIAAEFVQLKVDVIVTTAAAPVFAAKEATSVIPIVFAAQSDPVGSNLVVSLARPGGNITGLSVQLSDVAGKGVELLREVIPNLRRLAIIANEGGRGAMLEMAAAQSAARSFDLEVTAFEIRRTEDIAHAFDAMNGNADALYVCGDPLTITNRTRINVLALGARLPTMCGVREFVEAGGLMSYGPNLTDLFRRSADFVDKILRGTKPADIPVEQPTRFDLVVNLITAKALGLAFPETLLATADELIQ
jgi:putative tryptophan/tyrosine transport system substrate-binding protein